MRKLLLLSALVLIAFAATYFTSCNNSPSTDKTADTHKEDSINAVIARGRYLAVNVAGCADCHSQRDFTKYSGPIIKGTEGGGGFKFDAKLAGLPGEIYSKNITPDPETGIGTWTDDEILRAITQGINKKGDTLFPLMPYPMYNQMDLQDLKSIIAFIKTLKPIKNKIPERVLMAPISAFYPGKYLKPSVDGNVKPAESDKVKYGEYLVTIADCGTCHSPMSEHGPDMSKKFGGGFHFDLGTFKVASANISPDSATGIGKWTEDQFLTKFAQYRKEENYNFDPGKKNTIMPVTLMAGMTDQDLKAIYAYLRTVPPITNKITNYLDN
jgi:mono/diheme cytochrome c family protein